MSLPLVKLFYFNRSMISFEVGVNCLLEGLISLKEDGVENISVSQYSIDLLRSHFSKSSEDFISTSSEKQNPSRSRKITIEQNPEPSFSLGTALSNSFPRNYFTVPAGLKRERWDWLRNKVKNCPVCLQHTPKGKQIVFGTGNLDASIFFCGEAPGADEETSGEPFVGPAGQLLNRIIGAMGLNRKQIYLGNILNWRPHTQNRFGNRPPTNDEIAFCLPYLFSQISIIKPKVVVALGATAMKGLLGVSPEIKLGKIRGKWQSFKGIPLMVTYHPSYLLHNHTDRTKRLLWEDLLSVMQHLEMPISDKQQSYFL